MGPRLRKIGPAEGGRQVAGARNLGPIFYHPCNLLQSMRLAVPLSLSLSLPDVRVRRTTRGIERKKESGSMLSRFSHLGTGTDNWNRGREGKRERERARRGDGNNCAFVKAAKSPHAMFSHSQFPSHPSSYLFCQTQSRLSFLEVF